MRYLILITLGLLLPFSPADARKRRSAREGVERVSISGPISNFNDAKKYLRTRVRELYDGRTIYCGCKADARNVDLESCGYRVQKNRKRASRVEWEHVVPAEAFGQSFVEWREGAAACGVKHGKAVKGRKCAEKNPEFQRMEGDVYNLFPEIGELNGLRSNYSMAEIGGKADRFGGCAVRLEGRKFEPADSAKGVVARTYLNFENRYPGHGIVSDKNRKLFEAWDQAHPVTDVECRRWRELEGLAGYAHLFVGRCR